MVYKVNENCYRILVNHKTCLQGHVINSTNTDEIAYDCPFYDTRA